MFGIQVDIATLAPMPKVGCIRSMQRKCTIITTIHYHEDDGTKLNRMIFVTYILKGVDQAKMKC